MNEHVLILWDAAIESGYASNVWMTFTSKPRASARKSARVKGRDVRLL